MLELKHIVKNYTVGDGSVTPALRDVSISFRESEFVSILGPSGCGKTTLLNIIGGLDRYTEGDLIINGVSTKQYKDADWDTYRNHSIGFVFQSYNLIPHQTVLQNVELALTLSGVSKAERRTRAIEALEKVGLGSQIKKKPNQMSGGQMQRVAIARALVNNPDILLADEPTGALDTATSLQIMEILKEISKEKLIIMVTHNPELAERYSSRIIRLCDGVVTDDSDPYHREEGATPPPARPDSPRKAASPAGKNPKKKKTSMSFLTALSLSLNNLMTKKGRTFLTSFAGSIGIIGIALILSLSNGIQLYISQVQEDTLSTYPLTIQTEAQDYSALLSAMVSVSAAKDREIEENTIYVDDSFGSMIAAMSSTVSNNLAPFMEYLESKRAELADSIIDIKYTYNFDMQIYSGDGNTRVNPTTIFDYMGEEYAAMISMMGSASSSGTSHFNVFSEMIDNRELLNSQYDLVGGTWADDADEVMLVLNENNSLTNMVLYILGIEDQSELAEIMDAIRENGEYTVNDKTYRFSDFIGMTFYIVPASDFFVESGKTITVDGTEYALYTDVRESSDFDQSSYVKEHGIPVTVSGILRPAEGAVASSISGSVAYNKSLSDLVISRVNNSAIVKAQKSLPTYDLTTGLEFDNGQYQNLTDLEKAADFTAFLLSGDNADLKVKMMLDLLANLSDEEKELLVKAEVDAMSNDERAYYLATRFLSLYKDSPDTFRAILIELMRPVLGDQISMIEGMTTEQLLSMMESGGMTFDPDMKLSEEQLGKLAEVFSELPADKLKEFALTAYEIETVNGLVDKFREEYTSGELIALFEERYAGMQDSEKAALYDRYMPSRVSENSYAEVLSLLGSVEKSVPHTISIYAKDFASKDEIVALIDSYNNAASEEDQITYTDYVGLMMSSITTIIDVISYVLIAFVSISLVVSSIMIGIITYISVLERTKEIGILRAIGASKTDISRVFNAETLIVGFAAGAIGIVVTLLCCLPINWIIRILSGIPTIGAQLPVLGAVILILISMLLTTVAGLIPAKIAAKKDPVVALRTE